MDDERICGKCGSIRTRVTEQSVSPAGVYVQCENCGYTTLVLSPEPATSDTSPIDRRRIERLVNAVIAEFNLPFQLLSVMEALEGWRVIVRKGTDLRQVVRFNVKPGSLSAMRAAIQQTLEKAVQRLPHI